MPGRSTLCKVTCTYVHLCQYVCERESARAHAREREGAQARESEREYVCVCVCVCLCVHNNLIIDCGTGGYWFPVFFL